jgi:hypothetical protein
MQPAWVNDCFETKFKLVSQPNKIKWYNSVFKPIYSLSLSRVKSVGTAIRLRAGRTMDQSSIPGKGKIFYILKCVQDSSGTIITLR